MPRRSTTTPVPRTARRVALACLLVGGLLALRTTLGTSAAGLAVDAAAALAAVAATWEAGTRARPGRSRVAWRIETAGVALWLLAPLAWTFGLADPVAWTGRLGLVVCVGAAWWLTSLGRDPWARVRLVIDSGLAAGSLVVVAWPWLFRDAFVTQGADGDAVVAVAVPMATFGVAALATGVAATEVTRARAGMPALVVAALVALAASDVVGARGGTPFWAVGFALLVLATRVYRGTSVRREVPSTRPWLALVPYALLAPAVVALVLLHMTDGVPAAVAVTALVMVGMVLARQHVVLTENRGLVARLAESERALRHKATHDALTGLAGRVLLYERLDAAVDRRRLEGRPVAVVFLDLDDFKRVNDTYGHAAGDDVLVQTAARLREVLAPFGRDALAVRMSGDEFAALLVGPVAARAEKVAARAVEAIGAPMRLGDRTVQVGASAGVAVADDGVSGASELLRASDVAMYRVKRRRRATAGAAPEVGVEHTSHVDDEDEDPAPLGR
ncbi:GGDEF domain-containing protein [Cellulomonas sp. APG4]|uniref:GGDEF domain-containing protein n=1 Tax=Cellulomonas sp. APG4 TaxID=1538656 RepID=UPI0013794BCC|nr:GGDEF domain-containing protein [Cellulomonas sp. APG4]NCT92700.1 GGDEF domain-containing protein [Cellulomonas sp. APG4]